MDNYLLSLQKKKIIMWRIGRGLKMLDSLSRGCIMLSRDINVAFPSKVVWDSTVPQKVGIFSWEAT